MPIRIEPVGNPQHIVTEKQLAVALAASLPLWHPPSVPSLVHELKLWGKNCNFPPETVGGKGRTGQMMIETLLNDQICAENTVILGDGRGGSYLIDSPYGIHPIQSGSYDAMEYRAETHFGKLTMLMALTGVPLSTPVTTASGRTGTLADILQDTIMNFDWSKELEFAGCSFALWLPPEKSWMNQFDETFTFDDLMNRLLAIPLGKGTCGGCHVPYTVVMLLRVNEQYPIIETKTRQRAEAWIKHVIDVLVQNQLPDGTWDRDWGKTGEKGMLYNDIILDKITVIGHHLEWIALLPESFDVPKEMIQKAIVAVTEQIEQLPPVAKRSFKTVLPCSHAAKALALLMRQESFEVWQRLNQSKPDMKSTE
ncbi:hypothetical protein FACS1894189_5690 [Planctomycetales bacterium]|nr:hypothetical protein FACS1894189_5690 [Planctomycetales bacterium]